MTLQIGSNLCTPGLWCNTFCCCCRFHIRSKWLRFLSGFMLALTAARCACSLEPGCCCAPTAGLPAPSSAPPLLLQALAARVSQARPPGSAPRPCTLLQAWPARGARPSLRAQEVLPMQGGQAGTRSPAAPPAGRRAGLLWRPPPPPPARPRQPQEVLPARHGGPSQNTNKTSLHLSSQVLRGPCPCSRARRRASPSHAHTRKAFRTSPRHPAQGRGGCPCPALLYNAEEVEVEGEDECLPC